LKLPLGYGKPARTKNFPEIKIFPTACRIPVWSFVVIVNGGN